MPRVARFGKFEFDLDREMLRRSGLSVRLPPQPAKLLALLVERAGQVVTREEIQQHLWPDGTYVDFEQGINHSIRQVRSVLGDDAATARFIQTVPKVGYMFFGVVEYAEGNGHAPSERLDSAGGSLPDAGRTAGLPSRVSGEAPRTRAILPIAAAVVLLGTLVGFWSAGPREAGHDPMSLRRLTSHGRVGAVALSPDGRHLADARYEDGGFAIFVSSIETGSEMRILDPLETRIQAVSFSPDGERIYFVRQQTSGPGYSSLYRVPALGGPAQELVFDVDSGVGFSPDGTRMAYVRSFPFQRESALITADLDGMQEKTVSVWSGPGSFGLQTPSWSPDGTRIAVVGRLPRADARSVPLVVDLDSGERVPLGEQRWERLTGLAWLPDGREIVMAAVPPGLDDREQIWIVSHPEGEPKRLTNDLESYNSLSSSADGRSILTILRETVANLHTIDMEDSSRVTVWTTGSLRKDLVHWARSLSDGSIVYTTHEGDRYQLWKVNEPQGPRTSMLADSFIGPEAFEVSADAESILFIAPDERETPQLFILPASGGTPSKITSGEGVGAAGACSREGPFYIKPLGEDGLWRIDAPGQSPLKVSDWTPWGTAPYCSPDRTHVVFGTFVENDGLFERSLVVIPAEGGEPAYRFSWTDGVLPRWSPRGDALVFIRYEPKGPALFSLALGSGEVTRLTDIGREAVFSWDWLEGGPEIVASRGYVRSDVVLIGIGTGQDPQ